MRHISFSILCALLAIFPFRSGWALESITLEPVQDNTLYETELDQGNQIVEVSNGMGDYLFVGPTGSIAQFALRRALIQFDLQAQLPAGADIIHVELSMYQSKAAPESSPISIGLHRVLQAWGEGASDADGPEGQGIWPEDGDATWHHRIYPDILWGSAGGTFVESASSSTTIGDFLQHFNWSCNDDLINDVRYWQAQPESNFGWLLKGGEAGLKNAHRFNSRHHSTTDQRPQLTIIYQPQDELFADSFEPVILCP